MNQHDFIKGIKVAVHDATIQGVGKILIDPPGRQPRAKAKRLSAWFNALSNEDKKAVQEVVRQSVHASIFGFLCVLDGVRAIEPTPDKGDLQLTFLKDGKASKIGGLGTDTLHDIYQELVQQEVFEE